MVNKARLLGIICLLFVTVEITPAQSDPTVRINDITVTELDSGLFQRDFEVTLSAASNKAVSVMVSTQAGSATSNADFGAGSTFVNFQPGQTSLPLGILINGDTLVEGTEEFFVNLSNPINVTIADGQGVGTIVDDDTLLLLTLQASQRAVALDSVLFTKESLPIINTLNFSSDNRTRVALFTVGLKLSAGETASAVSATAEDSQGVVRPLTVEFVGRIPNFDWISQVVVRMNDQISVPGDVKIKISLHGATSNTVLISAKSQ